MALQTITVGSAAFHIGTAAEITAASKNTGDVGYATDTGAEYLNTSAGGSGTTWTIVRKHASGAAHVNLRDASSNEIIPVRQFAPSALDDAAYGVAAYTGTSANFALTSIISGLAAGDTVRLYCPTDVYLNFASDALETPPASASSMYFAAGTEPLKIPAGATHLNIIAVATSGTARFAKYA